MHADVIDSSISRNPAAFLSGNSRVPCQRTSPFESGLYLNGIYLGKKISVCNGASVKQGFCNSYCYFMYFFFFISG